jgi:hypothetical protein
VKNQRSDQGVEQAAERAADGDPEIELGQMAVCRTVGGQFRVAECMRRRRTRTRCSSISGPIGSDVRMFNVMTSGASRIGRARDRNCGERTWSPREREDKGQEVDRQRNNPQQGHDGHVAGEVGCNTRASGSKAQTRASTQRRRRHPAVNRPGNARTDDGGVGRSGGGRRGRSPDADCAGRSGKEHKHPVAPHPPAALLSHMPDAIPPTAG